MACGFLLTFPVACECVVPNHCAVTPRVLCTQNRLVVVGHSSSGKKTLVASLRTLAPSPVGVVDRLPRCVMAHTWAFTALEDAVLRAVIFWLVLVAWFGSTANAPTVFPWLLDTKYYSATVRVGARMLYPEHGLRPGLSLPCVRAGGGARSPGRGVSSACYA